MNVRLAPRKESRRVVKQIIYPGLTQIGDVHWRFPHSETLKFINIFRKYETSLGRLTKWLTSA